MANTTYTNKLRCILLGDGELEKHRDGIVNATPKWSNLVDYVVPKSGFNLHDSAIGQLTDRDRIFVFDAFPFGDLNIINLVKQCLADEATAYAAITVVIYDDNRKAGVNDIDTKESAINETRYVFGKIVGSDNIVLYNRENIDDLLFWAYVPYDERILGLYKKKITAAESWLNDTFDFVYDIEMDLLPVNSLQNYLTHLEKYATSKYQFADSQAAEKITGALAQVYFGNADCEVASFFCKLYTDGISEIILWQKEKDIEMLCKSFYSLFINHMSKAKYKDYRDYSDAIAAFFQHDLKLCIVNHCNGLLSRLGEIL